eukprot:TRINITY_DN7286_c0_g1_i1.p5 TRINITY_DN7286_c0_g1~~TRINITY_DN7286_c0_g1_i1.p5  ORF type:complete len:133 (+),score=8.96 TRINITY_DN7286_c0_g1_i1:1896-2294(+)
MLLAGTLLNLVDATGLLLVTCIRILGSSCKLNASLGDTFVISVKNLKVTSAFIEKKKDRANVYCSGTMHRVFIVRVKKNYFRTLGALVKFSENSAILVNKKNVPLGLRIKGPVPMEICFRYPTIGNLSQYIV